MKVLTSHLCDQLADFTGDMAFGHREYAEEPRRRPTWQSDSSRGIAAVPAV